MSKESYARGFCKAAAAHGVDPMALAKYASFGDIVNSGLSSMTMGSPFAPKSFSPGTSIIKPTKEIQQENARSAVGGIMGLGAPVAGKALLSTPALAYLATLPAVNVNPTLLAAPLIADKYGDKIKKYLGKYLGKLGLVNK